MTPQEKARKITYNIYRIIPLDKMNVDFNIAKKSALIAVDEILTEFMFDDSDYSNKRFKYWSKVKQEIEKL
jgi:hypothetical protein